MKKTELRSLIREEIKRVLKEANEPTIYFVDKDRESGTAKGSAPQSDWMSIINKVMGTKGFEDYPDVDEWAEEAQKQPGGKENHTMGIEIVLDKNNPNFKKLVTFVKASKPGSTLTLPGDDQGTITFMVK